MSDFSAAYTKQEFLKFLERQLGDDDVVVISTFKKEFSQTKKAKRIHFEFPIDGFRNRDGIKDLMESRTFSVIIGKENLLEPSLAQDLKTQWSTEA